MKITIGNKLYQVSKAKTEEERKIGLTNYDKLPKDEGMLFYIDDKKPQQVFTMKGMKFPIDIIFINQDLIVVSANYNCLPEEESIVNTTENMEENDYIAYVLEVNPDSGIKADDYLDFEEDDGPVMKVLSPDGTELAALWGGERIFSRKNTKILIKKAKKAAESLSDSDYKALGKYMFKCIKILDERPAEYVDAPK